MIVLLGAHIMGAPEVNMLKNRFKRLFPCEQFNNDCIAGRIYRGSPGLCCTATSHTDPPPRLHLLGANWRPWHFKLTRILSQKVGLHGESYHSVLGVSAPWLSCTRLAADPQSTLAVNRLGRCRATWPWRSTSPRTSSSVYSPVSSLIIIVLMGAFIVGAPEVNSQEPLQASLPL